MLIIRSVILFLISFNLFAANEQLLIISNKKNTGIECELKPSRLYCTSKKEEFLFFSEDKLEANQDFRYFKKMLKKKLILTKEGAENHLKPTFMYKTIKGQTWLIAEAVKGKDKIIYGIRIIKKKYLIVTYQSKKEVNIEKLEKFLNKLL